VIKDHNIIYFGPEKWEGMWRNRHQLMSRLATLNKVIYVEPRITLRRLRRLLSDKKKRKELFREYKRSRVRRISNNLFVYESPWFVPIFGRSPFRNLSWWIWRSIFKRDLNKLKYIKPIVWVSRPYMIHFIGYFNESIAIYHVVDEYSAYGELTKDEKQNKIELELKLIKKVDIVIVVSQELYDAKEKQANKILKDILKYRI